jgi:hypothetical protein
MRISAEVQQQIAHDRKNGMSVKDCCAKYSLNKSTICKYSKEDPKEIQEVSVPTTDDLPDLTSRVPLVEVDAPIQTKESPRASRVIQNFFKDMKEPEPEVKPIVKEVNPIASVNKNDLIQKIILNAESFPEMFPDMTIDSLSSKSVRELDELLQSMTHSRTIRSLSLQFKQMFLVSARATEIVGKTFLKMKTDGMTEALMNQQKELDFIFRELAIKHSSRFSATSEPEVKLLMIVGMTLLQTDASNRLKDRLSQTQQVETTDKYSDL